MKIKVYNTIKFMFFGNYTTFRRMAFDRFEGSISIISLELILLLSPTIFPFVAYMGNNLYKYGIAVLVIILHSILDRVLKRILLQNLTKDELITSYEQYPLKKQASTIMGLLFILSVLYPSITLFMYFF